MARLDELPDDILLCILDQTWEAWEEWTNFHNLPQGPEGSFQRSLLYVNKRFETVVERWLCSQIRKFENDTYEDETWLSAILPRPAMRLFMKMLGDAERMVGGKQGYSGGNELLRSIHQVTEYLMSETQRSENDFSALRDRYQKALCALAAAKLCSGGQEPFLNAFLGEDRRMERHAKKTAADACSIGGTVAIVDDDTALLTHFLDKESFDVNIDHKFFGNPILAAAQMGSLKCMKMLLEQPGREFLCNDAELNALHLISRKGDIPMMKLLLEHGDDTLYLYKQQTTPLGFAADRGHLAGVKLLLRSIYPPPITEDIDIAITDAASSGHEEVVKFLWAYSSIPRTVGQGLDIGNLNIDYNDSDDSDFEECSEDEGSEDDDSEDEDIEDEDSEDEDSEDEDSEDEDSEDDDSKNEDVEDRDTDNEDTDWGSGIEGYGYEELLGMAVESDMALLAARHGHENIVRLILDSDELGPKAKKTIAQLCFQAALQFDSVSVAQLLLNRFEGLANTRYTGKTRPLAVAAACTATGVIKLLLKRDDININHANMAGATAICYAIRPPTEPVDRPTDEFDALKLMVARVDVDVNRADHNGDTPLMGAAIAGDLRMMRALMGRKELNVNARNRFGETALSRAVLRGSTAVVKVMLAREDIKADVKNKLGQTPFLMAVISGHIDILELFLNRSDIDIKTRDTKGRTALWLAAKQADIYTVKYLMHHCAKIGVDLNQRDNEGISPLEVAKSGESEEYLEVVQVLSQKNPEKNITKPSHHTDLSQKFLSDDYCCVACLLIHPDAHGVYSGFIPGFSFDYN